MIRTLSILSLMGVMICGLVGEAAGAEDSSASRSAFVAPLAGAELTLPEQLMLIQYLRVAGSVLRPRSSSISFSAAGGGGCTYHTGGSTSTVWNTPVYLPQGATVEFVRMYFNDTATANSRGWFTIFDLYGSIVQEWSVSSSGSSGEGFEDTAVINHQVDYQVNSYVLNWRPNESGSDMQLCGFRIFYDN